MTLTSINAPVYRYFTVDLLSNALIAEIPFKGVSYERALKSAGSFSGTVPVISVTNSMDLYESTMPGKTALYIVRDNVCVWGGIIWSRSYDVVSRVLSVSASEFTSYLYHRHIWKTFSHEFGATAVVAGGIMTVTLDAGFSYSFQAGSSAEIVFGTVGSTDFVHVAFFKINASPAPTTTTFRANAGVIPTGTYTGLTVTVRTDTFDYVRQLLETMNVDFTNLEFPNDEIEPSLSNPFTVTNKARTSNVVTLTTAKEHGAIPGQTVDVYNVDSALNGSYEITAVPSAYTLQYTLAGGNIASAAVGAVTKTVVQRLPQDASGALGDGITMRLSTSDAHGFSDGDVVTVTGVDDPASTAVSYNGTFVIDVITSTAFTYPSIFTKESTAASGLSGLATKTPQIRVNTYGPFPNNSDIGLDFSATTYAPNYPTNGQITGAGLPATLYPASPAGLVGAGNIVLTSRPLVTNNNVNEPQTLGAISIVLPMLYNDGGNEFVIPRVIDGKIVSEALAKSYFESTGEHLGAFASGDVANAATYIANLNANLELWLTLFTYTESTSSSSFSGVSTRNTISRGHELANIGELIEGYSDIFNGFDFRIDCEFDPNTNSFSKKFVVLPVNYPDPPPAGEASPASRFGADEYVFEYPGGNITTVQLDESAENAATRFFVVGDNGDLGEAAGNPYAVASSSDFLLNGWPILEQEETKQDIADEETLYLYADRYLREHLPPMADVKITVNGSFDPVVGTYAPGNWCSVIIDDEFIRMRLASSLEPRDTFLIRKINGVAVTVPDTPTFPEEVTLDLITEAEVDRLGQQQT
jgi:hypothetical protein